MTDPWKLIHTPLGEPGSGRVRYGAAMALFARGLLPEAALEIYRICAALDAQDPAPLLRARGLAPVRRPGGAAAGRLAARLAGAGRAS
jgi:hypothetical protein